MELMRLFLFTQLYGLNPLERDFSDGGASLLG